jgi:DNA mismatch repair protein MutS2
MRSAIDDATLRKLEFDEVRETIARHCGTALGKHLARTMAPSVRADVIREWLDQVRELLTVSEAHGLPPMGGVFDIREFVRASSFPAPLEADALARIAETLMATAEVSRWIEKVVELAPSLAARQSQISDLSAIAAVIYEAVDPRGEVLDNASPKLMSIRSAIETTKGKIRHVFDRILRQGSLARMLQYSGSTFHNDRMVLPLKAEYRGRIQGIIHRSSDTGSTLFVEPAESVELNNSVISLRDSESKEVTRILKLLTQRVSANAAVILTTLRAMAVLDLIAGKCRYARQRDCACPIIDDQGVMDLHNARHPLLIELFAQDAKEGRPQREIVPIDVRLGEDFDVLVLTGPNTGGKTVTIKTVGLLAVMAQCGIPIPAGPGSRLPAYHQIFIDIGDEQSLQQSLSTFSSHLANLLHILTHCGRKSLVLIDELGAGTDPDEGAAIGRAIVAELLRLEARAIVTTHISTLKAVAYSTPRVDNAAVEFDPESLRPTYHVRMGEPGNSNALVIAKRLGMSARLVQQASEYLDDTTRALNKAIAGTLRSRREAEEARRAAREAAVDSQREKQRFEVEQKRMEDSREAFESWTKWLNALRPGDPVYVKSMKRRAKVVRMALHQQKALVSTGAVDFELSVTDLDQPRTEE